MKNYIFCFVTFSTCILGLGDARADVIVNFTEVGGDVVSSAEGSIDVVGLDLFRGWYSYRRAGRSGRHSCGSWPFRI